jgi:hypothetical protein
MIIRWFIVEATAQASGRRVKQTICRLNIVRTNEIPHAAFRPWHIAGAAACRSLAGRTYVSALMKFKHLINVYIA